ncbi:MAG: PTS transporter subunit IIC [Fusobacteriaceae bacterium]
MEKIKMFLERKNIEITVKRYLVEVLGFMALGLFSSLLIGTILNSIGMKFQIKFLTDTVWPLCRSMTGATIGVAVAYALKAPPLVVFSSVITGAAGNAVGGPVGALIASLFGAEFGKMVSKETKVDILVTPITTILVGITMGGLVGPYIEKLMTALGLIIMKATELSPINMGIVVSVIMGIILTLPISSAAIAIMLKLSGIAAGAATVGCSSQMIGFAVMSFRENGWGGFVAQGLGTSMLQMPNIIRNWKIWIPPILTSAVLGPVATKVFKMENIPIGAGMGTSGLVGQFGTITAMSNKGMRDIKLYILIFILHILAPAVLTYIFAEIMRKIGWIKEGDMKLEL